MDCARSPGLVAGITRCGPADDGCSRSFFPLPRAMVGLVSNKGSDGIGPVLGSAAVSGRNGSQVADTRRREPTPLQVEPVTDPRTPPVFTPMVSVPSVPILSQTAQAMNPQKLVGRDINRGLVVACLILTTATARASSDGTEKDRFLTCEVRAQFPAKFAARARCGLTRRKWEVASNMRTSQQHEFRTLK